MVWFLLNQRIQSACDDFGGHLTPHLLSQWLLKLLKSVYFLTEQIIEKFLNTKDLEEFMHGSKITLK